MHGPGFGTFSYREKNTDLDGITFPAHTTLALWNPQGLFCYFLVYYLVSRFLTVSSPSCCERMGLRCRCS